MRTLVRVPLTALAYCLLALGCEAAMNVRGSGRIATEERSLPEFERVELCGFGDVHVRQGETQVVEIKTDDNVLPLVKTRVRGSDLTISVAEGVHGVTSLDIYVMMRAVRGLSVSGAGNIRSERPLVADHVDLSVSGAGSIHLDCEAREIQTRISGAGDIVLSGHCDRHTVAVSGAGDLRALGLVARKSEAVISGAGDCELHVLELLNATVSGAGDISYKGDPMVNQRVSGAGSVRRCER